ncbi:MAG: hypothetical protein ISR83_06935 [Candidatus Marinimicrobia bacterium]|nr:hypothetical protein [Candidatus Neomarinimicrobiota bacterium]
MNKVTFRREGILTILCVVFLFSLGVHIVTRDNGTNVGSIYYGAVPGFNLQHADETPFTLLDLRGETWVINYVKNIQSSQSSIMADQINKFAQDWGINHEIKFLTITHETNIAAIQSFIENNRPSEKRWEIITGNANKITELVQNGFHIPIKKDSEPNRYILVDNNGQIRGYYTASDQSELSRLSIDVNGLMRIS